MTKVGSVDQHSRERDQQRNEVHAVVGADAIHQPDTVMIMSRDTSLTEAAMFAACWLEKFTGTTTMAWVKENSVVRITSHLLVVVLSCDG